MIKMIDQSSFEAAREYCLGDPFGCRILAAMLAYGTDKPFALFWAQYEGDSEEGAITAVISRLDTAMTVCAKGSYDEEELDCFIQANMGYTGALRPAREGETANGLVMRLARRKNVVSATDAEINPEISDVYAVMEECAGTGFEVPRFDDFYSDMIYRKKAKTVLSAIVRADGMPAACGAVHLSPGTALLTICACVPEMRGKGYAGKVFNALLDRCADRDIYLMCMPSLHDFYAKYGFLTIGGFIY